MARLCPRGRRKALNLAGLLRRNLREPAERVDQAHLLDRPRAEVVVGVSARTAIAQAHLAPRVYERLMARYIDATQFEDAPASSTEGNLFQTSAPKSVSGGWAEPSHRARHIAAGVTMGGLAAFVAMRKLRR